MMRALLMSVFILFAIPWPAHAASDLAGMVCQDEYKIADKDKQLCQGLLIGTIDSLQALGEYCPDGKTSYGYIIDTWRRLLSKEPNLKSEATIFSMRRALSELGLLCKSK